MTAFAQKFRVRLWLAAYRVEELRQSAAASGNLWAQAGACIGLALLRLAGG